MSKKLVISEQEKKTIKNMYGLNEQDDMSFLQGLLKKAMELANKDNSDSSIKNSSDTSSDTSDVDITDTGEIDLDNSDIIFLTDVTAYIKLVKNKKSYLKCR